MIDSHTHLDSTPGDDAEIVGRARAAGVQRMLTVGTDHESRRRALAAAERFEGVVYAAVGHHPNSASGFSDAEAQDVAELAADARCRAIGETGLDYYRDHASREDQARAFAAQIEIARATGKPLVIHTREADDDTIAALAREARDVTVILHCFSMASRFDECLDAGWFISFAGNVTYPKSRDLTIAAERVPDDRLLVETDAPYLTPQAVRKERNRPAFVAHTAEFVAARRGQTLQQLEAAVEATARELFAW